MTRGLDRKRNLQTGNGDGQELPKFVNNWQQHGNNLHFEVLLRIVIRGSGVRVTPGALWSQSPRLVCIA
jgi:hypothetical protein